MRIKILLLSITCLLLTTNLSAKSHKAMEYYGDIMQIALPVSAGIYSLVKHDYVGTIHLVEGAAYTEILTEILKYSIHEHRPDGSDFHSFPSGHTMSAMNAAGFMQFRYGAKFGIPYYALGVSVAVSRISTYKHNWWDTLASTAIATFAQFLINKKGMSVAPYIMGKGGGISVSKTF